MNRIIIFFAALVFSISISTNGFANFADTYGFSAKGIARGNAVNAIVNDWSSVYYNISGLGKTSSKENGVKSNAATKKRILDEVDENNEESASGASKELNDELALTYLYGIPQFKIDIERDDVNGDKNLKTGALLLGLVLDLNHIALMPEFLSSARFGLGLGALDDLSLVKVNDIDIRSHNFLRYGREAQRIVILAGTGFGFLNDMFGFGAGANALIKGAGSVIMRETEIGPNKQTPAYEAKLNMKPDIAPVAGIYADIGKILKIFDIENDYTKGIKFGASFRGELSMAIEPFSALAVTEIGNINLNIDLAIFDYYTPNIYTTGLAYEFPMPIPFFNFELSTEITFDYEFQQWSRHIVSKAREKYWDIAGVKLPEFKDIHVFKCGLAVEAFDWMTVSSGFYYQPYFVSSESTKGVFNLLDNDKYVGSLGFEFLMPAMYRIAHPVTINVAFQYQYLKERKVTKNQDVMIANDPTYDPALNPDYKYGGQHYLGIVEVIFKW